MKISLYTNTTDIVPVKETFFDKIDKFIFKDEKRNMFKTQPLDLIFSQIKQAGVDGLELISPPFISEENIKKIKSISQKYNLEIFSIHQPHDTALNITLNEIEQLCSIARGFLAHVVVLHVNALGNKLLDKNFIEELKKLQNKYLVTFGIENMPKSPFTFAKKMYQENEFSAAVNQAGLSITLDTTHVGQVGGDIVSFYAKNKEKIINIHISDYRKSWLNRILFITNGTHLSLTDGELPIAKFLKTLNENNYQGLITMEINGNLSQLCQSAEMIKNALR